MEKIFIVEETTGEYEDRFTRPVKAFRSEEEAKAYCDEQNKYYGELSDKYDELTDPASTFKADLLNEKAFEAYLKDVAPDYYEEYENLSNKPYDNECFNWDLYYDYESEFESNSEAKLKYYKVVEISDEDIEKLGIIDEYNSLFDGIPYFTVSKGINLV